MRQLPNLEITSSTWDVDEIISMIRKAHGSKDGLRFVYIDYLQNLHFKNFRNPVEAVEDAVKKIHSIAQELHIVVFLLAQLVKGQNENQNKEKQ